MTSAVSSLGLDNWSVYTTQDKNFLDLKPRPDIRNGLDMDTRRLWLDDIPRWIKEELNRGDKDVKDNVHTEL